ncbi:DUF58 domain-containing protein [Paenibacillus hexagrammi]|uniref:DUF58 domain-containing protein n=1 Tax=Paenibacillus hexagrammi TaxID=2908839 RepID=A0ABY3SN86_9BACL|nr:DUF58 domain-containing protein [Paenibacillus sp. YPD9-1]UJF35015.1 DUF58 domain-containing protein [Paenibacillus sp. YPD9-1]
MNRQFMKRLLDRSSYPAGFWAITSCVICSLFFLLFQGGKLAAMLFFIVLILAIYLLLGNWSGVKRTRGVRKLAGAAQQSAELQAGHSLKVTIEVQIPGVWPIAYMVIRDQLIRQNGEESVFEGTFVPDWKRKGEVLYSTPPLRRGLYRFGYTECSTEDIFGFFQHKGRIELREQFVVYPQTAAIREWTQFHQMMKGLQHNSASTRAHRETTQINGVREYIYGDRLSRIHWGATAKTGTWKSKEFERESLPKTILLLDRSSRAYRNAEEFELAVSVTASLFRYASSRNLALGLVSVGKEAVYMEPQQSHNHYRQVMSHLVSAEADGFHSLSSIIKDRARQLPAGCFFVLVSPQNGSSILQLLHEIERLQMNPCHMWIHPSGAPSGASDWLKQVRSHGYAAEEIRQLDELPNVLGGAKRYA